MDDNEKTVHVYDQYAQDYDRAYAGQKEREHPMRDVFVNALTGNSILDLGCGPGYDAVHFARLGYDVLCVDASEQMVRLCKEKGLDARVVDMRNLGVLDDEFDGIWAAASLLHVARDAIPDVLASMQQHLKPGGIAAISLKAGTGEEWVEDERTGANRHFVFWKQDEFERLLEQQFKIIWSSQQEHSGSDWLYWVLKKD